VNRTHTPQLPLSNSKCQNRLQRYGCRYDIWLMIILCEPRLCNCKQSFHFETIIYIYWVHTVYNSLFERSHYKLQVFTKVYGCPLVFIYYCCHWSDSNKVVSSRSQDRSRILISRIRIRSEVKKATPKTSDGHIQSHTAIFWIFILVSS